jgi:hypothetical protein
MEKKLLILMIPIVLGGCFSTDIEFEDQYLIVVEGYIYSGANLAGINLTSMISFGNDSTPGEGIEDAAVTLWNNTGEWLLQHNPDSSGNYIPGEVIPVQPGDTFHLLIETGDLVLESSTVVPAMPPAINLSADSLYIPKVDDPREMGEIGFPDPIELTWENPDGKYYYFRIDNIEDDPVTIMPDPPDDMPFRRGGFAFQMFTRPVNDEVYMITPGELTHFGTHRLIVYSVNQEYVNLYETQEQDTRKLNEPFSNIDNGLGIFTSFSSDTMYFEVIPVYE